MNPDWWLAARRVFKLMVPVWETKFFSICRVLMTAKFSGEGRGGWWADRKADGAPLELLQGEWKSPFLFLKKRFSMENGFCQNFSAELFPVAFNDLSMPLPFSAGLENYPAKVPWTARSPVWWTHCIAEEQEVDLSGWNGATNWELSNGKWKPEVTGYLSWSTQDSLHQHFQIK